MTDAQIPNDIRALADAFDANLADAHALIDGLSPDEGVWQAAPGTWSVSECLDHLATGTRVYLVPMHAAAARARSSSSRRRGPAVPGVVGSWFVAMLEPPPKWWSTLKAPSKIRPRTAPPLGDAFNDFVASHNDARAFLIDNADIDLAGVGFANPFVAGIRFSLATGLHVTASHERRHLQQAWRVRRAVGR